MRSKLSSQQKIGEQIGKELRAIYDVVLDEPIPERFLVLVDRLGEGLASGAPAAGQLSRRVSPQATGRVARVPKIIGSLPRGVTRLERV